LQDKSRNLKIQSATAITDKAWMIEVAIPFADLESQVAPSGKTWRVNLAREYKAVHQNSSWSNLEDAFHEPVNFGIWEFSQ